MNYLLTLLVAIVGGIAMSLLHAPLPWTLGPITAVSLCSLLLRAQIPLAARRAQYRAHPARLRDGTAI